MMCLIKMNTIVQVKHFYMLIVECVYIQTACCRMIISCGVKQIALGFTRAT